MKKQSTCPAKECPAMSDHFKKEAAPKTCKPAKGPSKKKGCDMGKGPSCH